MKQLSSLVAAGAAAVLALGIGAAGASAYSISGGAYTGAATVDHTATFGFYTASCPASGVTYTGTATGADTTSFTPSFGGMCDFFGLGAIVSQSGPWSLEVIAGPDLNGIYQGRLTIPAGTSTVVEFPALGCTATISGPQNLVHGASSTVIEMWNAGSDVALAMSLNGLTHGATGTCFPPSGGGAYSTNGPVMLPGVTIS